MLEALECTLNVSRHRKGASTVDAIPIHMQDSISLTFPINADLVVGTQALNQVFHILFVGVLDSKVIYHQTKGNGL